MHTFHVQIIRFVDDSQPGWVECALTDAEGVSHHFLEKVPVVSTAHLDARTQYPQQGTARCVVLHEDTTAGTATIDTNAIDGIESNNGQHVFTVPLSHLRAVAPP